MTQGLWVIGGLVVFLVLEKMFPDQESLEDPTSDSDLNFNLSVSISAGISLSRMSTQVLASFLFLGMLSANAFPLSLHICQWRFDDCRIR